MTKLRMLEPQIHDIQPIVRDVRVQDTIYGDLVRPERLPKPTCKVWLVCGPPAAGKSTYVRTHSNRGDIVIDLDAIAREYGMSRERPSELTAMLLLDRNERLAALANQPPDRTAWVIIGGASQELRNWWCNALNVKPECMILLKPHRAELYQRIENDPDRRSVRHLHKWLVDKWFVHDGR